MFLWLCLVEITTLVFCKCVLGSDFVPSPFENAKIDYFL